MTTELKFNSFVLINYNGRELEVHCKAKGKYYYQPCVMYFKDGSGQTEDEDFEIEDIEICKVIENGGVVTDYDTEKCLELAERAVIQRVGKRN